MNKKEIEEHRRLLIELVKEKDKSIKHLQQKIDKAIEILKDTSVDMPSTLLIETIDYARHILGDKENE